MENNYRLQLRHGAEGKNFSTRDEVITYINGQLEYGGVSLLPYEPVLFFYGTDNTKNTIILVGLPEGKTQGGKSYFLVDTANLQEQINQGGSSGKALEEKVDEEIAARKSADEELKTAIDVETTAREAGDNELKTAIETETSDRMAVDKTLQDTITLTSEDLKSVIDACGLIYNEKLTENRVSYTPDSHDEVIRDSKSVADAVDKISKFATQLGKSLKISVANTATVDLTMEENTKEGGSTIKADVNIAGADGLSKKTFDNNIIGQTTEGIYAAATIEPSTTNPNVLIFKTSGYVDGTFKVDAYETEVPLTAYKGDSGKNSGIAVDVDATKNVISATLNLSSDANNILKLEDGEYVVDGVAKNIKYKDITVAQALVNHTKRLTAVEEAVEEAKAVEVKGSETPTSAVTVEKSAKGDFTVANSVKLSTDNSIIVTNGGLKANVTAEYQSGKTTLVITVGTNKYELDLSSLAVSSLKSADYDATNEEIVLTFYVGKEEKTLRIPVGTLIHDVEVDDTDSIDLTLKSVSGGPNHISGEVRIDKTHSDNILTVSSNGLYVSKAYITNAVLDETNARIEAVKAIQTNVDEIATLVNTNKEAIAAETTRAEKAETANTNAIATETARAKEAETTNATAIVKETERASEKEGDLQKAIDNNAAEIKQIATDIATEATTARAAEKANADAIVAETARAKEIETANAKAISDEEKRATAAETANSTAITTERTRALTAEGALETKVNSNTDNVAAVTQMATDNKNDISNEIARAKEKEQDILTKATDNATAIANEIVRAKAAENANSQAIVTEQNRALAAEKNNADAIAVETLRATTEEGNLTTSIETLTGKVNTSVESLEGKITNEATTARAAEKANATDIAEEILRATAAEKLNAEQIATKANANDVYTKNEITKTLQDYVKAKEVQTNLDAKLNISDAQSTYATNTALQTVKDTYATVASVEKVESSLDERITANKTSIDNFGLTYNAATSELVYTDKSGQKTIYQLYSGSLIKRGEFDTKTNSIVLTIENAGIESKITIPVSELLSDITTKIETNAADIKTINSNLTKLAKDWTVSNSSTVALAKTTIGEKDSLEAKVKVSTSNKQAIQTTDEGLYVSKDLEDFTVVFGAAGTISGQTAISTLLEKITDLQVKVEANTFDISNLKESVATMTETVRTLKDSVTAMEAKVAKIDGLVTDVTALNDAVAKIKSVTGYETYTATQTMSNRLDELEGGTGSKIAAEIERIENELIGPTDGSAKGSVWEQLNNIVDAGNYNL